MEFTRDNYIVILGSSIVDLKLKGNELICYSLIQGFCQDNQSMFAGSLSYIAEALGVSKRNVIRIIDKLCEKKLIEKITEEVNNVKINKYKVAQNVIGSDLLSPPPHDASVIGGDILSPNNTANNIISLKDNNNINNINIIERDKEKEKEKESERACEFLKNENEIIEELKHDESWCELICMRYHRTDIQELISEFVVDNECRGQTHTNLSHLKTHFVSWLNAKLDRERRTQTYGQQTNNLRRGYEVTAISDEEYSETL